MIIATESYSSFVNFTEPQIVCDVLLSNGFILSTTYDGIDVIILSDANIEIEVTCVKNY